MARKKKESTDEQQTRLSLREQILGKDSAGEFTTRTRGTHVMTRLSDDIVRVLDALVELGIFNSRSEAVAAYVEKAILSNPPRPTLSIMGMDISSSKVLL